ncbi:MAG: hypothetical protein JXR48_19110 [Candidatus Delongbacteria bacterium]|nr:hypothetical protein [Candidatus Delongbacteria bacterium]
MKKIININFIEGQFLISCDSSNITTIDKASLSLNGKELFENLFKGMDRKVKFEFDVVVDASIVDTNDIRIGNDIKRILDNIATEINIKFNLLEEDPEVSL